MLDAGVCSRDQRNLFDFKSKADRSIYGNVDPGELEREPARPKWGRSRCAAPVPTAIISCQNSVATVPSDVDNLDDVRNMIDQGSKTSSNMSGQYLSKWLCIVQGRRQLTQTKYSMVVLIAVGLAKRGNQKVTGWL